MFKKGSKKVVGIVLLLLLTMVTTIACSSSNGNGGSEAYNELTVYTALPDTEIPVYLNAFEEETGIKVNYVRLSAGEILAKLQVEKNNPQASVWYGGPIDTFIA